MAALECTGLDEVRPAAAAVVVAVVVALLLLVEVAAVVGGDDACDAGDATTAAACCRLVSRLAATIAGGDVSCKPPSCEGGSMVVKEGGWREGGECRGSGEWRSVAPKKQWCEECQVSEIGERNPCHKNTRFYKSTSKVARMPRKQCESKAKC